MTGLGRIYRRNEVWWIDYSFRGQRHRESSGSSRKKDAQQLLRKRTMEMGRGRVVGPDAESLSYEDLETIIRDNYVKKERRSTERLEASLKALRSFFGGVMALDITTGPGGGRNHFPLTRSTRGCGPVRSFDWMA